MTVGDTLASSTRVCVWTCVKRECVGLMFGSLWDHGLYERDFVKVCDSATK